VPPARRLRLLEDFRRQTDLKVQLLQNYSNNTQSQLDELAMLDAPDTTTARDHAPLTPLPDNAPDAVTLAIFASM
jgi:hypothetical protein